MNRNNNNVDGSNGVRYPQDELIARPPFGRFIHSYPVPQQQPIQPVQSVQSVQTVQPIQPIQSVRQQQFSQQPTMLPTYSTHPIPQQPQPASHNYYQKMTNQQSQVIPPPPMQMQNSPPVYNNTNNNNIETRLQNMSRHELIDIVRSLYAQNNYLEGKVAFLDSLRQENEDLKRDYFYVKSLLEHRPLTSPVSVQTYQQQQQYPQPIQSTRQAEEQTSSLDTNRQPSTNSEITTEESSDAAYLEAVQILASSPNIVQSPLTPTNELKDKTYTPNYVKKRKLQNNSQRSVKRASFTDKQPSVQKVKKNKTALALETFYAAFQPRLVQSNAPASSN